MSTSPTTRRFGALAPRTRWALGAGALAALLVVLVVVARWAWGRAGVQDFVARYPGVATGAESAGSPAWVGILHFFNLFLMALMIKSGLMIHNTRRPAAHWTRRGRAWLARSRKKPATITLEQWFHVSLDLTWLVVGTTFFVLLFTSGRWVRLVPTSWDVFPNALSVILQYLSLHWPQDEHLGGLQRPADARLLRHRVHPRADLGEPPGCACPSCGPRRQRSTATTRSRRPGRSTSRRCGSSRASSSCTW